MKIKDIKIKTKIIDLSVVIISLIVVLSIFVYYSVNNFYQQSRGLIELEKLAAEFSQIEIDHLKLGSNLNTDVGKRKNETYIETKLNTSINQVNINIQSLNQVVQQNAATSEELATSSKEMAAQTEQVKQFIQFFKLKV